MHDTFEDYAKNRNYYLDEKSHSLSEDESINLTVIKNIKPAKLTQYKDHAQINLRGINKKSLSKNIETYTTAVSILQTQYLSLQTLFKNILVQLQQSVYDKLDANILVLQTLEAKNSLLGSSLSRLKELESYGLAHYLPRYIEQSNQSLADQQQLEAILSQQSSIIENLISEKTELMEFMRSEFKLIALTINGKLEDDFDDLKYGFDRIKEYMLTYSNSLARIIFIFDVLQNHFRQFDRIMLELYESLVDKNNPDAIQTLIDIYSYGFCSIPANPEKVSYYKKHISIDSDNSVKICLVM